MEGFQINYTDIYDLFWEYKTNLENLMNKIDTCENCINFYNKNAVFTGETGDAVKSYLTDVHITMLSSIRVTAQNLLDNMTYTKPGIMILTILQILNLARRQSVHSGQN